MTGHADLPGPAIDTGPDPADRRVILPRWLKAMAATALTLASASLLFSAVLYTRSGDALKTAKVAVQAAQLQALQSCVRNNVLSARVKTTARIPLTQATPKQNAARLKVAARLFPILDCKQSQVTRMSVLLSPRETARYIQVVDHARAPIVNRGRVVGSRPSVLQNVRSFEQAGRP